jgi:biotin carboxyl carrier protein
VKTLNASEGAVVREGDVLLLMEAGGAVFQFPAPAAGTVKRLCVSPGDSVEAGQVLVILKDKEDGDNA